VDKASTDILDDDQTHNFDRFQIENHGFEPFATDIVLCEFIINDSIEIDVKYDDSPMAETRLCNLIALYNSRNEKNLTCIENTSLCNLNCIPQIL